MIFGNFRARIPFFHATTIVPNTTHLLLFRRFGRFQMKCDTQLDRLLLTFSYFMHTNKCFRIVYLSVIGCHRSRNDREEYNVFIITVYLTAHNNYNNISNKLHLFAFFQIYIYYQNLFYSSDFICFTKQVTTIFFLYFTVIDNVMSAA